MNTPSPRDIADRVMQYAYSALTNNEYSLTVCQRALIQAYIEALRVEANELEEEQPDQCTCFKCTNSDLTDIDPTNPITFTDIIQQHIQKHISNTQSRDDNDFITGAMVDDLFDNSNDEDTEKE